jgi:hypothetical protein
VSGYRHSGMSREDFGDRAVLLDAISVIQRRWPTGKNTIVQLLKRLAKRVEGEA